MRKWLGLASVGLMLVALGCAAGHHRGGEGHVSKDTQIHCPKCGVEFQVHEGMEKKQ
ncbi:MAG: hypothetical protein SCH98_11305 [Deferrisomatales bacterium]|nr:hypothetical protein [Deferrisomatales bacterium]